MRYIEVPYHPIVCVTMCLGERHCSSACSFLQNGIHSDAMGGAIVCVLAAESWELNTRENGRERV